jgi:hypothetical protein|nr:MAG TPA: hypothetical protein [Caudoviricetes sp.]
MINYKTPLEITFENLENARKNDDDYLIENSEIEALLDYLEVVINLISTLLLSEDKHIHTLNDIEDICNGIPGDWTTCDISIIHKIEEVLNRDE